MSATADEFYGVILLATMGCTYLRRIAGPQYGVRPRWRALAKIQSPGLRYRNCSFHFASVSATCGSRGTGFCEDSVLRGLTTQRTLERITLAVL